MYKFLKTLKFITLILFITIFSSALIKDIAYSAISNWEFGSADQATSRGNFIQSSSVSGLVQPQRT